MTEKRPVRSRSLVIVIYFAFSYIYYKGYLEFYEGLSPFLIGSMISQGVYFYIYELLKSKFKIDIGNIKGQTIAAFVAGFFSSLMTTPFWVL